MMFSSVMPGLLQLHSANQPLPSDNRRNEQCPTATLLMGSFSDHAPSIPGVTNAPRLVKRISGRLVFSVDSAAEK
jgi:hypothetical protein